MKSPQKTKHHRTHEEYFKAHECHLPANKIAVEYGAKCGRFRKFILDLTSVRPGDIRARNMYKYTKIVVSSFCERLLVEAGCAELSRSGYYGRPGEGGIPISSSEIETDKSYAALCSEKNIQYLYYPFSIHPFSKLRIWCDAFFFFIMLTSNTILCVHLSEPEPMKCAIHNYMMYIYDIIYVINIIMNFFTGYIEGYTCQYVVLNLRKIWFRYATTWLVVDIMAVVCCLPTMLISEEHIVPHMILISMKLLRLPIMLVYIANVLTVLRVGIIKRTIIQIVTLILSYVTWNIFFQFVVEYVQEGSYQPTNPRKCSWISIANLWNQTTQLRFVNALDRAVGMLRKNTNINLISKDGCFENFFVVSWLIAKLLVYHCGLKYIVAVFGSESAKAKYFIMTKQVETYMNTRKFPPRIKHKIMKFYSIRYQSNYFAESKMLACVTGQLREDIIMHTGRQLVRELVFLKKLPRTLLLQIGLKLRIVIFIAGDIIFKINTVGDCLYFIDKGTVAIYSESGNEICHLEDGDFFGEIALVMKHPFRTTSAVAVTNCELFRLDKVEFDNSIACYPTVYETIKKVAIDRFEKTCVLDEHHKTELKQKRDFVNPTEEYNSEDDYLH